MAEPTTPQDHNPGAFLDLPPEASQFLHARALILPLPLEQTVSYGGGTGRGPEAIIQASQQVELYDREFGGEPALAYGVHTLPGPTLPSDLAQAMEAIAEATHWAAATGKFVVGLGGEHTVSVGFGRGLLRAVDGPITVVQIDAHCDLRDEYEGTPYSHACIARRLLEDPRVEHVVQLGIRSLSQEEADFARAHPDRVSIRFAEEIHSGGWADWLAERIHGRQVYLTLDVDGLDPSVVPATGTPEPDGLTWAETLAILRCIFGVGDVLAMDCVELAPVPGLHMAEYAVAKLLYKAMSYQLVGVPMSKAG